MDTFLIYGIVGSGCFVLGAVVTYVAYRAIYRNRLGERISDVQSAFDESRSKRDAEAKEALAERDRSIDKLSKANEERRKENITLRADIEIGKRQLHAVETQDVNKDQKLASAYEEIESLKHQLAPKVIAIAKPLGAKKQVKANGKSVK